MTDIDKKKTTESHPANYVNIKGVGFQNIVPCTIIGGEHRPLARSVAKNGKAGVIPHENPLPGGHAFMASTNALGKTGIPVKGAALHDGRNYATLDFQHEKFDFTQLFDEFELSLYGFMVAFNQGF